MKRSKTLAAAALTAALTAVLTAALPGTVAAAELWTAKGFDMCESVLVDTARDHIIVSVIGGNPMAADGNGGLALLAMDGADLDRNWVTGLDAPKGMAIVGDAVVVADLNRVHEIDLASGAIRQTVAFPGAVFLNDVASDGRAAYVSDTMTNSIWRYQDGKADVWLKDDRLGHPNGLLVDGDRLLVGTVGQGLHEDFTTDVPGSVLSVALDSKDIGEVAPQVGNIDGLARAGDAILFSDWVSGALFAATDTGAVKQVGQHAKGLADITAHDGRLYVPMMLDGTVSAISYP